jgi:hypothetical protein
MTFKKGISGNPAGRPKKGILPFKVEHSKLYNPDEVIQEIVIETFAGRVRIDDAIKACQLIKFIN